MKYARVFLKGSDNPLRWVDVPLASTSFAAFCATVRMQGCVAPQAGWPLWLPFDEIKYMIEIEVSVPTTPGIFGVYEGKGGEKPN